MSHFAGPGDRPKAALLSLNKQRNSDEFSGIICEALISGTILCGIGRIAMVAQGSKTRAEIPEG